MIKQTRKKATAGFTLIELIMVIVILGILAAVAVPKFFNLQDDAKIAAEMGVAGAVRSGIGMLHGALITEYASNTDTAAVLQKVTGISGIDASYDTDRDGWLQRLQLGSTANATDLFEFVMKDPLAGGTDGGSDGWVFLVGENSDARAGGSYTGPASSRSNGIPDETASPETGKPDRNDEWDYTERDNRSNDTDDGRFVLQEH
ncbi:MAG: hypothetical protein DRH04_08305 [Deltaproteobacteria bacterium]|nr:MAG: hypothetical protein DRH04_08305 [Deltaproteobacteria bacterium]